jgi:hypothetical protein
MKNELQIDWWGEINYDEKVEIEEGLVEADRGEVFSHEEVMSKYRKYGRGSIENGFA